MPMGGGGGGERERVWNFLAKSTPGFKSENASDVFLASFPLLPLPLATHPTLVNSKLLQPQLHG